MAREHNPQVGWCTCPLCSTAGARVHQSRKSTRSKLVYYFCDQCGCIQPTKKAGQAAIMATFEPMEPGGYVPEVPMLKPSEAPPPETVLEPAPVPEPEPATESAGTEEKRGFAFPSWLFGADEDDE